MQRLRWLVLMSFWMSLIDAGKLQLAEPFDYPESVLEESWEQFRRMRSMGNRSDIAEKIRVKQVARYLDDINDSLNRLESNRQLGTASFKREDLVGLWILASPYKFYPMNLQTASVNLQAADDEKEEEDDDLHRPLLPDDDDAPSFSDGDNSDVVDDLEVHVEHDQENDDLFAWQ